MLAEDFRTIFREEHRYVRDRLLDLALAFQERDTGQARSLVADISAATGPHFRYEEETLYPDLVALFGRPYVEDLLRAHDRAIDAAKQISEIAAQNELTDDDVRKGIDLVRVILPHVSDCDGLSIMVEKFADDRVQAIFDARERSAQEALDLFNWANTVRHRTPALPG